MRTLPLSSLFVLQVGDRGMDVHLRLLAEAANQAIAGVGVLERSTSRTAARCRD